MSQFHLVVNEVGHLERANTPVAPASLRIQAIILVTKCIKNDSGQPPQRHQNTMIFAYRAMPVHSMKTWRRETCTAHIAAGDEEYSCTTAISEHERITKLNSRGAPTQPLAKIQQVVRGGEGHLRDSRVSR